MFSQDSSSKPIQLAALDLPGNRASQATYNYFQQLQTAQNFPIHDAILVSQNLRMRQVEEGARNGQLNDFSTSVGRRFLGVVGEALVWKNFEQQSASPVGQQLTHVIPQPVTLARQGTNLPPEIDTIRNALGAQEPDMAIVMVGGEWRLGPVRVQISPQLKNVVSRGNPNGVEAATFRANSAILISEITTSRQYTHIRDRAQTIGAYGAAIRAANISLPGTEIVPLLIIDRGAYFQLNETQKAEITNLVHSGGGRIMLLRFSNLVGNVSLNSASYTMP